MLLSVQVEGALFVLNNVNEMYTDTIIVFIS